MAKKFSTLRKKMPAKHRKRAHTRAQRLLAAGWKTGSAAEFVGLTEQRAAAKVDQYRAKYVAAGFRLSMRLDSWSRGLIEAHCEHGVGHPIPESVAEREAATGQDYWGVHGCDGCCAKFPKEAK